MESFINDITDDDRGWGPLLFLRPPQHETMTAARQVIVAVLLGSAFGMVGSILLALVSAWVERPPPPVYAMPALLTALYWGVCRHVVAPAWNARAGRLVRSQRR